MRIFLIDVWFKNDSDTPLPLMPGNQHRPAIVALMEGNFLEIYDAERGTLMTSVVLRHEYSRTKFKEISCSPETSSIVVKSTFLREFQRTVVSDFVSSYFSVGRRVVFGVKAWRGQF